MAKVFKDFLFAGHKLSEFGDFIAIDFDGDSDIPLALERDMEMGETNKYRIEPNFYGDKWSSALTFELHIIKDICKHSNQKEMQFSQNEIREIARWLTSPHYPNWINFEYTPDDENKISFYKGWFNNIETYVVGGAVYGLRLSFTCTTSFGYTDEKIVEISGVKSSLIPKLVENNGDELESYCYPQLKIYPNSNGECFICNISDAKILDTGERDGLDISSIALNYASDNLCSIRYSRDFLEAPVLLCDGTAMQFYLVNKYGDETKCTILHSTQSDQYYIIEGGFMFMNLKQDLEVNIDCQKLIIQDSLNRMITYDELGITDVDNMYWLRLVNGVNQFIIYGDMSIELKFRESRKVGE